MASEGSSSTRAPAFNGKDYTFWKVRMCFYLKSLGSEVWDSVRFGYTISEGSIDDPSEKRRADMNAKAHNALLSALSNSEMSKVINCTSTKEVWDRLQSMHEGDMKIKEAKLQTYRAQFETLHMNNDEIVGDYLERVNNIVLSIRGLDEKMDNSVVVKKVLRTLTAKYESKVSAIEEAKDLNTLTWDELYGSLTAYEMRADKGKGQDVQASFRSKVQTNENNDIDDDEVNFVRKLTRGKGKYKGKLPFKCFDCGRIGHIARNCPMKATTEDQTASKIPKNYRGQAKGRSFVTEELEDDSNDESDGDLATTYDNPKEVFLFIAAQNTTEEKEEEVPEIEVDLLEEYNYLSSRFDEERQEKEEARKQLKEANEMIAQMQARLEELEDKLTQLVKEKDSLCKTEPGEVQIAASKRLDEIINSQRPTHEKFGLGYKGEKWSSSKSTHTTDPSSSSVKEVSVSPTSANIFKQPETSKKRLIRTENQYRPPGRLGNTYDNSNKYFQGRCYHCNRYGHRVSLSL